MCAPSLLNTRGFPAAVRGLGSRTFLRSPHARFASVRRHGNDGPRQRTRRGTRDVYDSHKHLRCVATGASREWNLIVRVGKRWGDVVRVCACVCASVSPLHTHARTHACTHTHTHTTAACVLAVFVCVCVCMYVYVCVCMRVCVDLSLTARLTVETAGCAVATVTDAQIVALCVARESVTIAVSRSNRVLWAGNQVCSIRDIRV